MFGKSAIGRAGIIVLVTAVLSACAGQPETIVASDAAFCQYSAAAGVQTDAQCRQKLQAQSGRLIAANASRIEGYALLNAPLPPADIAGRCKEDSEKAKDCDPADLTGSIPAPKR